MVDPILTKPDIVRVIRGVIPDDQPLQTPPTPPPIVIREAVGAVRLGLLLQVGIRTHPVDDDDVSVPSPAVKSLLRLKRGELTSLPKLKQLELLLKEQEELQNVKENPGQDLLQYIMTNLQEMSQNSNPLPPELDDTWVLYLY